MPSIASGKVALLDVNQGGPRPAQAQRQPQVAVIIPCYNEAASVVSVIESMRAALPDADIYVYDNNSTDNTAALALGAGAIVGFEGLKGKGNVVRRMFADVEADIYVMVDGDNTYDASAAPQLIERLVHGDLDMVTGAREDMSQAAYRLGHRFGNLVLTNLVAHLFGRQTRDMLSGYRIMSRRFVKSFPILSQGFEIETELTVHALGLSLPTDEITTPYIERGEESESKLNTIRDGFRILGTIMMLLYSERPLFFFGGFAALATLASMLLAYPVLGDYLATGLVERFPTAILSMILMLVALLCLCCGLILKTVTKGRQEMKRLAYLQLRAVRAGLSR